MTPKYDPKKEKSDEQPTTISDVDGAPLWLAVLFYLMVGIIFILLLGVTIR